MKIRMTNGSRTPRAKGLTMRRRAARRAKTDRYKVRWSF